MAAVTFTADAGTDVITAAGHGLNTGDGPCATRNIGGALPGGLAPVTDYFFIRLDANTGKLATSSANALLGTAINLTTNGTGTNILEIGVPYRRPRTYAPGVQLFSSDLNANFDALVALHGLLTGQAQSTWSSFALAKRRSANAVPLRNNQFAAWQGEYHQSTGSGTPGMELQVPFEVGDRIVGFEFAAFGNGAADCTLSLSALTFDLAGSAIAFATVTDTNRAAAWSIVTVTAGSPHTMAAGEALILQIDPNAAGYRVKNVAVVYDRPLP